MIVRVYRKEVSIEWLREPDLNQRPSGYEPDELPTALSRDVGGIRWMG